MAFNVTPTSGAGPYSLSAVIANAGNIDGTHFVASVVTNILSGSCPLEGTGTPISQQMVDSLIAGNSVQMAGSNVPPGSCRSFTLALTQISDAVVIDSSLVTVDNL